MHAAYARGSGSEELLWHRHVPTREPARPQPVHATPAEQATPKRNVYGARSGTNWIVVAAILLLHAVALMGLISYKIAQPAAKARPPLVVELLHLPTAPPPQAALPEPQPTRDEPPPPELVASEPVVTLPTPVPAPIVAAPLPSVPAPLPRSEAAPEARIAAPAVISPPAISTAPVSVADLSTRMITGSPPRYPIESRRRREQGTVVLAVLVDIDGAVAEVDVSRSSGFSRLDKAARDAVRRWRWSPTLRDGRPVLVRGYVDIPFILNG